MAPRSTYKVITDDVKAIRAMRETRGLSVNKAAPLIGTNKSTLTALENGRKSEKVPDILTLTEIKTFLEAARDIESPWYPIWAMALLTGMRNGECMLLSGSTSILKTL